MTPLVMDAIHDDFVVPANFDEFFARYPNHVHRWVARHLRESSREDREDWTQDLLLHLSRLPEVSKHRDAGLTDVIQTFDPVKQHGASAAFFFSYVNNILANKVNTMRVKRAKNPLCRFGTISLVGHAPDDEEFVGSDEHVHANSPTLSLQSERSSKQQDDRLFADQFKRYVRKHDKKAYAALAMMMMAESEVDAYERGMLQRLAKAFVNGVRPKLPKRRKSYKKHGHRQKYKKGCRCPRCVDSNRAYQRLWYSRRAVPQPPPKSDQHGTVVRYSYKKCRCDLCREAWSIYSKAQYRKHRDAKAAAMAQAA